MFSNNLKTAIGKRSIADLADETKLNRQQIYRYVKGTALPRADAYLALCQELEIDPSIALNKDIFAAESSQLNLPQQPITKHLTTPDDNCMAEGLYHVYCPSIRRPGKFGRHTLALKLNKGWLEACWQVAFKTIPYSVPANLRRSVGYLVTSDQLNVQMYLYWSNPITNARGYHIAHFGRWFENTQIRFGHFMLDDGRPERSEPCFFNVVIEKAASNSLREVHSKAGWLDWEDLPPMIGDYFEHGLQNIDYVQFAHLPIGARRSVRDLDQSLA